jgi:hypothetical protein
MCKTSPRTVNGHLQLHLKLSLLTSPSIDTFDVFQSKICNVVFSNTSLVIRGRDLQCRYAFGSPDYAAYVLLMHALEKVVPLESPGIDDLFLEFGVASRYSINVTSLLKNGFRPRGNKRNKGGRVRAVLERNNRTTDTKDAVANVYGFDWFRGLPEAWGHLSFGKGVFTRNGSLPLVRNDVRLVQGLFNETLGESSSLLSPATCRPYLHISKFSLSLTLVSNVLSGLILEPFLRNMTATRTRPQIAFMNVDNDLYDGAVYILTHTLPWMKPRGVVHFHDFFKHNHSVSVEGQRCQGLDEMRALYDVLKTSKVRLELLPVHANHHLECALFRVRGATE